MRAGVWAVAVLAGGLSAQVHAVHEGAQDRGQGLAAEKAAQLWLVQEHVTVEATLAEVVKGAPYSADVITETTRTLADGNRIQHKSVAKMYRDSQGRVRREHNVEAVGPWTAIERVELITISDPGAKVSYSLNPRDRTARKILFGGVPGGAGTIPHAEARVPHTEAGQIPHAERGSRTGPGQMPHAGEAKSESLGKRVIEGVEAEGTRTTSTIPAGQIGNERPIQIVAERWYSRELQAVVYSKRMDPMAGETVYRLANVNRSEPPAYLFEVPPDYQLKESKITVVPHRHESAPK